MLEEFREFILKEGLVDQGDKVLIALSGGVDSVVMAELFHQAKIPFAIAHCNFQLRGKESDDDEVFAENLARKYKVVFYGERFDTGRYAVEEKMSIQAAARKLRYDWFDAIAAKNKFRQIATAHHRNDVLETMLINFTRGTGIAGLHGILPRQGNIIRPLLFTNREQIERFAQHTGLAFRYDSSNSSDKYVRNKIRMRVIPILKEINPSIDHTAVFVSKNLHDVETIYNGKIEEERKRCVSVEKGRAHIHIKKLKALPAMRSYLYEFIREFNFNAKQIEQIMIAMEGEPGTTFYSDTHQLVKDRENFIISPLRKKGEPEEVKVKKSDKRLSNPLKLSFEAKKMTKKFGIPAEADIACLDFDKLDFPLVIRRWHHGDRFIPLGMGGTRKLSDFLTDNKISLTDKEEGTWVLLSGNNIVWVIGKRIDERFKVTPRTRKVYLVKLKQ